MPNTHTTLSSLFSDIADAIRAKKHEDSSWRYRADYFPQAIAGIVERSPHADAETEFDWAQLTTGGGLSWSGIAMEEE